MVKLLISRRFPEDDGAEIVQLALCVPILIVLIMSVVQLCIMAFFTLTLTGTADQVAWEADVSLLAQASNDDANAHVKDLVLRNSVHLEDSRLQIANASFSVSSPYSYTRASGVTSNKTVISEDSNERFTIRQLYREVKGGLVEFDISYKLPTIINLPGLSDVTVTRHVAHERLASTRTEIR